MRVSGSNHDAAPVSNPHRQQHSGASDTAMADEIPSDAREAASLLYRPSDPIALRTVLPEGATLPKLRSSSSRAVPDLVKRRNRDLLEAMRQDLDTHASDAALMVGLRSELRELATQREPPSAQAAREENPALARWHQVEERLPRAFRFDRRNPATYAHWTEGDWAEQSAIVRPTPSHLLKTPHPAPVESQAPPSPSPPPPPRTPSPLRRIRAALASGAKTAGDENKKRKWEEMQQRMMERIAKRHKASGPSAPPARPVDPPSGHGQEQQPTPNTETSVPPPQDDSTPLILSISVYSRPVQRSTRYSRSRAAAQKQQSEETDAGTAQDTHGIFMTEMFAPRFGQYGTDDEPCAAQTMEIYSTQTLQDLADGIVCRNDEVPEKDPDLDLHCAHDTLRLEDTLRYTGRKRPSEFAVLVEGTLAGLPGGALTRQLRKHLPGTVPQSLSAATFESIPDLRLHKPYWMCHQGICEHFWTIDEVRLPTQADPPLPRTSDATEQYRHPLTTHLSLSHLDRPVSFLSGVKAVDGIYHMGTCSICDKCPAKFLVIGGEAIGDPTANEGDGGNGAASDQTANSNRKRLPALLNSSEPFCAACLDMYVGRGPSTAPPNPRRRAFRSVLAREAKGRESEESVRSGVPSDLTAENAKVNADVSEDPTWQEIRERLKRERGWTVVPLLD